MAENNVKPKKVTNDDEIDIPGLFKVMFHRWKLLLAITAGTAVVGTLGVQFLYTNNVQKYQITYSYDIPSMNDKETKLLNDVPYNYMDSISEANIKSIVDNNKNYASIDVDTILNTIKLEQENLNESTDVDAIPNYEYTITIPKKYLKDYDVADAFIKEIASYPVSLTNQIAEKKQNDIYLINFEAADYDEKIDILANEYDYLNTSYTTLISENGDDTVYQDKLTSLHQNDLVSYYTYNGLNKLLNESCSDGGSGALHDFLSHYREYNTNNEKITSLTKKITELNLNSDNNVGVSVTTTNALYESISKLITDNVDLKHSIDDDMKKLSKDTDPDIVDFSKGLYTCYEKLKGFAATYTEVEKAQVKKSTKIHYNSYKIEVDGGLALYLEIAITAAVGLVAGWITNICLDHQYINTGYPKKEETETK